MNAFSFHNATLKSVYDYGNIAKGIVQSRQASINPDGTVREKFVASRQVTFQDPAILAKLREQLANNTEFKVTLSGYMTTSIAQDKKTKQDKWYDNQIVTEIEFLS